MSYLDDLKKKAQGVVNTVQNAYNTAQNVAGAVKSGVQNVYNAATGNTQQRDHAAAMQQAQAQHQQPQQTQPQQTQQAQAQTATQPTTNWVDDYDAFENERAMGTAGQETTAPTTQAQGTESAAQSGMNLTQNSQWQSQLDDVMNKIMAGEKFNYDMNSDAMYQQYRDIYENQANMAMQNAMAQNAALTGGYGSSYGQMVGQQAYAQQMQGLNEIGLDLYDRAYNQYQNEQNNLYNQSAMLAEKEALDYNRDYQANRDTVGDQQWEQAFDYQKAQDEIAQGQWQDTFDYQKEQDALAQENYQNQFDYQQSQDALAQKNYENEFAYQQNRDQIADSQWQQTMDYQQSQDQLAQSNWEKQFEYQQAQNELAQKNYENEFAYQQGRDEVADEQWLKQYEQWEKEYASSEEQRAIDNKYREDTLQQSKDEFDALYGDLEYDEDGNIVGGGFYTQQNAADNAYRDATLEQNKNEFDSLYGYTDENGTYHEGYYEKESEKDRQHQSDMADTEYDRMYGDFEKNKDGTYKLDKDGNKIGGGYYTKQNAQNQDNWQAEFDREGEWYDDALEGSKTTTKYEGEGSLNGQEVPKQLAGTLGLTTTNTNLFDSNGQFKHATIAGREMKEDMEGNSTGTITWNIEGKTVTMEEGYNPYTGTINSDTQYGTFGNGGYQPDNVMSMLPVYNSIEDAKLTKTADTDYVNGVKTPIYRDKLGYEWIWDDANNEYLNVSMPDRKSQQGVTTNPSVKPNKIPGV